MRFSCRWASFIGMALLFLNLQRAWAGPNVRNAGEPTLQEKVGQLLFIGIADTQLSERTIRDMRDIQPGAIILFKRNITSLQQTLHLNNDLRYTSKEYSNAPLLIATDQEGGRVARVEFTPPMPSPLAIGMTKDPKIVEAVSFEAGKFLRYLGFNMNLAPVLDVLMEGSATFIGERSFGTSSRWVSELGAAFAQGQLRAGIIPTSKHFPGAGLLTKDPHVEEVSVGKFSDESVMPFRQFAQIFPSAVMMSHSSYPTVDASGVPATFSKKIITDLLMKTLNYKGLIVTDDLRMGAVMDVGLKRPAKKDIGELAVKAFLAGADLLMITWGPKEQKAAKLALINAVKSGRISEEELDARVAKIVHVKSLIAPLLRAPAKVDNENTFESKTLAELDDQILGINISREFNAIPPSSRPRIKDRFIVIAKTPQFRWSFERALGKTVSSMDNQDFLKIGNNSELEQKFLAQYDCAVFPIQTRKDAIFLNSMSKAIRSKVIAVNLSSPGLINESSMRGVINLYHPHVNTGRFLGELVRGPALE